MNNPIDYTPKAEEHLVSVLKNLDQPYLVFGLKGGGCAGFEYDWGTIASPADLQDGDEVVKRLEKKAKKVRRNARVENNG